LINARIWIIRGQDTCISTSRGKLRKPSGKCPCLQLAVIIITLTYGRHPAFSGRHRTIFEH